jgi:putative oxygen-independent coproporphyrinogen III oxidase
MKWHKEYYSNKYYWENKLTINEAAKHTNLTKERLIELVKSKKISAQNGFITQKKWGYFIFNNLWFYPWPNIKSSYSSITEYSLLLDKTSHSERNTIYIHIPFCQTFCDFCSYAKTRFDKDLVCKYLKYLKKEIKLYAKKKYIKTTIFSLVYLGGGTPSCLTGSQLIDLLNYCKDNFNLAKDVDVTVEGTPASFSKEKIRVLKRWGINRLSFGVQTFDDEIGKLLNLPQSSRIVKKTLHLARNQGIGHLDIDLMYNLPGQKMVDHLTDLNTAVNLGVDSFSLYSLMVDPFMCKTLLYKLKTGELPDINLDFSYLIKMKFNAMKLLRKLGYETTSVVGCRRKKDSKRKSGLMYQNIGDRESCGLDYEQGGHLGLGAGALGYMDKCSYANAFPLEEYFCKLDDNIFPIRSIDFLSKADTIRKRIIEEFKNTCSVSKKAFSQKFGKSLKDHFSDSLNELESKGLLKDLDSDIVLSDMGRLLWMDVLPVFF